MLLDSRRTRNLCIVIADRKMFETTYKYYITHVYIS